MYQLYAKIKRSSKYYKQNFYAVRDGEYPFPIKITPPTELDDYIIKGGPGGQYRLEDVDLFVTVDDIEIQISGKNDEAREIDVQTWRNK